MSEEHEIAIFNPKLEDIEQLILERFDYNLASDRLEIAKELGQILNWFYTGEADF